ncbi:hypothetical protein BP5796_05509 [Coleophoma crateriformis]|uniref:Uncharacterized protein n=1 Tax=Coleophoma crateriformis TaxID=565419 RepID=A0A3D8S3Y5_9HELO|nr:hypothetical protein BP5796_05509 [Coleophoma crateriformis]
MSTPAASGPQVPSGDKPKRGLSKYVAKFKKAIKDNGASKRLSLAGASKSTAAPGVTEPSTKPAASTAPAETTDAPKDPEVKTYSRAQLDAERAKKLGERFKLSIEPHEWSLPSTKDMEVKRIEKPIRMRVHRTCHKCGIAFGANKACAGCQHTRCTKCPRYPSKKAEKKPKEALTAAPGPEDNMAALKEKFLLVKPSKTGGQPLVRKKPKQRVRRTCHSCSTLFQAGTKECSSCGHIRCEDCPRDPAKKAKYPDGYPGDEPSPSSIRPKKFMCEACNHKFEVPHDTNTDQPPPCTSCGETKTARVKPKKVAPAPDPEILKRVEEKLAAMKVST